MLTNPWNISKTDSVTSRYHTVNYDGTVPKIARYKLTMTFQVTHKSLHLPYHPCYALSANRSSKENSTAS